MKTVAIAFLALLLPVATADAQVKSELWDDADRHSAPKVASTVDLVKLDDHLYLTEHVLYIVDIENRIDWPQWGSVYNPESFAYYGDQLLSVFPDTFMTATFIANDLEPNYVPRYGFGAPKARGIGFPETNERFDICWYNEGGGFAGDRSLAVFDHEIGHAWGVNVPFNNLGHWPSNSTVYGQMGGTRFDDGVRSRIIGNPSEGFRWRRVDEFEHQRKVVFSDHLLYFVGVESRFPDAYVLEDPIFHPDSTISYTSVTKYDHDDIVASFGPRDPSYRTSPKQFRLAFVYVARSLAEVETKYAAMEESVRHFSYAQKISPDNFNFRVPFLVLTKMRASVATRLADLDGNASPRLSMKDTYLSISTGETASFRLEVDDPDGAPPAVTCLAENCAIEGDRVIVGPMQEAGSYFFTVHAKDAGGKHAYSHFVLDVTTQPLATTPAPELVEPNVRSLTTYPNPLRATTTIQFEMQQAGMVSFYVYDLSGRQVAAEAPRWYGPGQQYIDWTAAGVPSGTYFIRVESGGQMQTRPVAVAR